MAELFANMVVSGRFVEKRAKRDKIVQAKMQRMKELLHQFCSKIDEEYWEMIRGVDRTRG